MKKGFDRLDFLAAVGLFVSVAAWAFLWSHPYPHPDLWPFLVAVQGKVEVATLGIAGRFALGAFAALVYLVIRGFWFLHRDKFDELPDNFCYTRTAPICGAAIFALLPYSWRAGQFLSPEFAVLVLSALGLYLWFCGRGGKGILAYSLAYLLFGFVGGLNLLALGVLGFAAVSDVIIRWKDGQKHGQREDDDFARRKKSIETWFSVFTGLVGFILGAYLVVRLSPGSSYVSGLVARIMQTLFSPGLVALLLSVVATAVALAVGRRVRSVGRHGLMMCRVLSGILAIVVLTMLLRSVDRAERMRLQAIREYVSIVADDAKGAKFLFSDGRFDDVLRLEFASRGSGPIVLNTMAAPTRKEAEHLKTLAPEPADSAIFEAGGAEVFKAWARERPDRLAESAWQLGGGIVRRHGKAHGRTSGSVMRCEVAQRSETDDAADKRFIEWSQRIAAIAEEFPANGSFLGGTDDAVAAKFDALLWRAARLAGERAERQTMQRLDGLNASLRMQGEIIERMLPTEKLVFTAREALDVALKRADFELARRYAGEILAGSPDDPAANFALGMANLEAKEYFRASVCFEKALKKNPNEPAALNNLAIAYMKLGQGEKALDLAERAAKARPGSAEIRQTLAEIRKNVSKERP